MILTLGDSVTWGQGLLDEHKFDRIYAAGRQLSRIAHSGAIIGTADDSSTQHEYPEVPVSFPSVWQQVRSVSDWSDVDLVLVNGGINDVSLTRILDPTIVPNEITKLTQQYCGSATTALLRELSSHLVKPTAHVALVGYYPILSSRSSFENEQQPRKLMEMHQVPIASVDSAIPIDIASLVPGMVSNCLAFWHSTTDSLKGAVDAVNNDLGRNVCFYVDTGFTEANALWGQDCLLWELSPELEAEDEVEVKELRRRACEALYGDLVHLPEWGNWYQCCRASVGHPNIRGAAMIASAIAQALSS